MTPQRLTDALAEANVARFNGTYPVTVSIPATPPPSPNAAGIESGIPDRWMPRPISELGPSVPPDWILAGFIARRHITLLTSAWKTGKSTWVSHLLADLGRGAGMVSEPLDAPVLVVSEEGTDLWKRRRDELELDDNVHIVCRPFQGRPMPAEWRAFVRTVAELVIARGYALVVLDTLPSLWAAVNENDAADVLASLTPLTAIVEAGAALLVLHHPRKSGDDSGQAMASRGSGAIPGFVDTIIEMRRFDAQNPHDRRRTLRAFGRFSETPAETVIELRDDGYHVVGDRAEVKEADRTAIIVKLLPVDGIGATADELLKDWPGGDKPGLTTLRGELVYGAGKGLWVKSGTGHRGDPFRFRRGPDPKGGGDSIPATVTLGGALPESNK